MKLLDYSADLLRWMAGVVLPMVWPPTRPRGLAWFAHVVLIIAVAVGLWFLQPRLGLTSQLGHGPVWFQPFWSTTLFLTGYALLWSAAWLWALLTPPAVVTIFPDLDECWATIQTALAKADIALDQTPLYLVFGEWPCGAEAVFRALPNGMLVAGATSANAPLRAFAHRDGIYITMSGASLLGFRGELSASVGDDESEGVGSMFQSVGMGARSVGISNSVGASYMASVGGGSVGTSGGQLSEIQRIMRQARDEGRALTEAERQRLRELTGSGDRGAQSSSGRTANQVGILQNPQIAGELAARLIHVCGLVKATRYPLCPINGAVVAVPATVCNDEASAQQWGLVAREDLVIAEECFRQRFPVYVLVNGVEQSRGGTEFFRRFAAEKGGRVGKGFPLNPDLDAAAALQSLETPARWVAAGLLPYWALRFMSAEGGPNDRAVNADLFRFVCDVQKKSAGLAGLVGRTAMLYEDRTPLFGGTYLTVVLPEKPTEARFAKEFFAKVHETRSSVAWTPQAYAEESSYRRAVKVGYFIMLVVLASLLALAAYVAYAKGLLR